MHAQTTYVSYQCQKRSLWAQKEVDVAQNPVVGHVMQEGDAVGFPRYSVSKAWIFLSRNQQVRTVNNSHKRGWRRREACTA